ncbi:single-stranded DNA-binding protein, mitochondrial-like [Paramacrobiotus metropolitanus]|uniref:single-stranded DNA-binding protein, mitochondrial-like n=1 Tax=Paramacrobiotus metropolitanus TaxID=2943436 RepID=UPI002445DAB6|nr:single-stranded DNA-binding protein, mitochondrial-like [Paramacrobiotus metropolitanus]
MAARCAFAAVGLLRAPAVRITAISSLGSSGTPRIWNVKDDNTRHFTTSSNPFQAGTPTSVLDDEEEPSKPKSQPSFNTKAHFGGASGPQDVSHLERLERTVNLVTLMGRVGGDPQMRGTEENPVLLFSVATHENFRDTTGAIMQKTMWHRIAIFRPGLRETVFRICKKGHRVYVTGVLNYGNVKDPETGNMRTIATVVADNLIILSDPAGPVSP